MRKGVCFVQMGAARSFDVVRSSFNGFNYDQLVGYYDGFSRKVYKIIWSVRNTNIYKLLLPWERILVFTYVSIGGSFHKLLSIA